MNPELTFLVTLVLGYFDLILKSFISFLTLWVVQRF